MRFSTSVYLLLLAYIITALVWWEISLQKQSAIMYDQQVITLKSKTDSLREPELYNNKLNLLKRDLSLRKTQFISEGTTFLIVILIGAFVVYTSFVRRIRLSRQQNNFMLSVTHELKSPIAAMKLNMQTLEKHQLDEEKRLQLVTRCIKEANRLNDLCNNILVASQIEGRQYKQTREDIDLSGMLQTIVKDYRQRYSRPFEDDIEANCDVIGDRVMLQMAVTNLLENAVKYTRTDRTITLGLHRRDDYAAIQIKDEGDGIPDSEKKKIFKKFYRIGNEESRKAKGTGLGLYLTNKIVIQHKGRITIKDNAPKGSIFEISLPLA